MRKDVLGAMALAMLLIMGLIAPAIAMTDSVEAEPGTNTETPPVAADPCKVAGPYTHKHDVSPDDAVNTVDVTTKDAENGDVTIGRITANDPKGVVTVSLDAGYEISLCVFGGKDRLTFTGVADGFASSPPLMNPGEQVAGVSNFAWGVTPTTEPDPDPETITITLMKEWFDEDGEPLEGPPADLEWLLELYVSEEGEDVTKASLPGTGSWTVERGAEDAPVVYGIREPIESDRYDAVPCDSITREGIEPDLQDTSDLKAAADPDGFGAFVTTLGGVHLVCNMVYDEDEEPSIIVTPPAVEPPPVTPPTVEPPPADEVEVLPEEPREAEEVVEEPAPVTAAPEAPEPAVEVRGEVVTRTTPTRIDSGTGGSQDNTGLLALLLTGGLALSGFGITSAATTRRRR